MPSVGKAAGRRAPWWWERGLAQRSGGQSAPGGRPKGILTFPGPQGHGSQNVHSGISGGEKLQAVGRASPRETEREETLRDTTEHPAITSEAHLACGHTLKALGLRNTGRNRLAM